jgi:diguanylate cyclase (GGDEF)-like protein
VIFLDLDRFKHVNDTQGHLIGDELLRSVALRLSALVRSGDTLARFSGDEFVFLCEELASLSDVSILVGRIDEMFAEPFRLAGVEVTVGASVGTAYVGPGDAITSDLLMRADLDMYRAKREGAGADHRDRQPAFEHRRSESRGRRNGDPHRSLDLCVNVSVRQLIRPDFCATVSAVLRRTHMRPCSLVLEVTESIAMEHSARIMQVLVGLTEMGVRLALDDFGTGCSSLSYLSRLPIQIVKIDQGFIAELDQPAGRIVVSAIAGMAHELGLTVVAEGVETETQRDQTIAAGCDFAQGYYVARPMPADDIHDLLVD